MPRWIWIFQTCSFSLHKTLIDELKSCVLLVDCCDVFISCLNFLSDGTHSLQRIHWWASDVMLNVFFLSQLLFLLCFSWPITSDLSALFVECVWSSDRPEIYPESKRKIVIMTKGHCTRSPKFSYAFFRIRNPKNSSCTETLHTEFDAY